MAERWEGILRACCTGCPNPTTVMASLRVCPTTGTLMKPSSNAILFMGDCVRGTGNPIVERLSRLENVAAILVSKLGASVNAWVLEASRFQGPFACYEAFVPCLTPDGEPLCYDPKGLPAVRAITSLLNNCLAKVNMELHCSEKAAHNHLQSSFQKRKELQGDHMEEPGALTSTTGNLPKTSILGFSKGGVVLNQLLAELAHVELHGVADMGDSQTGAESMAQLQGRGMVQHKLQEIWIKLSEKLQTKSVKQTETVGDDIFIKKHQSSHDGNQVFPATVDEFLRSIAEIHYVDVGLNCSGAYQTDASVLENVVKTATLSSSGLHLAFHGTPRQWNDKNRYWISSEKDRCITLLQDAAHRLGSDKVRITERLYFGEERPSLQMHFKILESLVLN